MFPGKKVFSNIKKPLPMGGRDKSTMCKIVWMTWAFFLLAGLLPGTVFGHPPKSVTLSYDAAAKMLKVTILHSSFMPSWHYVKTVTVEKNKQPVATYPYKSQPGDEFSYTYEIPASPGDTFAVTASCSMYGSQTGTITIPAARTP